ncbi:MAG TPA: DUF1127 domain-containing protein [Candidatus Cybelea sp.]|nr:DUF1127 domain-containing protein [Candidatus Cybelea sp.]
MRTQTTRVLPPFAGAPEMPALPIPHQARLRRGFAAIVRFLRLWRLRMIERAFLAQLSDHQLWDMGLTRWEARREIDKPFWR